MAIKGGRNRFWEKVKKDDYKLRRACVELFGHIDGQENYEVMPRKNLFEFMLTSGDNIQESVCLDTILDLGDGRIYACGEYHGQVMFSVWDRGMLDSFEFEKEA